MIISTGYFRVRGDSLQRPVIRRRKRLLPDSEAARSEALVRYMAMINTELGWVPILVVLYPATPCWRYCTVACTVYESTTPFRFTRKYLKVWTLGTSMMVVLSSSEPKV